MSAARCLVVVGAIAVVFGAPWSGAAAESGEPSGDLGARRAVAERLDRMPLLFVPEGMGPDGPTGFVARGREGSVWLGETGLAYRLHPATGAASPEGADSWVVALDLVGASPRRPVGEAPLPTRISYFTGPKERWRTGLPSYGSVVWREPWPGIDLVVSGAAGELKSTFVVQAGADPSKIRLAYRGATTVRVGPDGGLVAETPLGDIREQAPVAYQEIDGRRVEVAAAFELEDAAATGRRGYRFRLGEYDPAHELVVDPVTLVYCGYVGGADWDVAGGIAVDADGNAYIAGKTGSDQLSFPVVVGPDTRLNGDWDAFVAKVRADGTALEYCGYIGGSGGDGIAGIAVDATGNAYVAGMTDSHQSSFPVTVGPDLTSNGGGDAFVAKISADGTALEYCGYVGGSDIDYASGIAVDSSGNAYVVGGTKSTEATFPVTVGPDLSYNGGERDAFVARVNASGTRLDYCGYIGGSDPDSATGVAVDAAGRIYVTGSTRSTEATFPVTVGPDLTYYDSGGNDDVFVARVNAAGTDLEYCGYIGGAGYEWAGKVAVDGAGNAYVAGSTTSDEMTFPVQGGPDLTYNGGELVGDVFVAKINVSGAALEYCGYIGGSDDDTLGGIAVDGAGNAYVTGRTTSTEATFPVTNGPDLTFNGENDAYLARVNADGTSLEFCGYIGGAEWEEGGGVAVDSSGNAFVLGTTFSTESTFPVLVGPDLTFNGDRDAFVAKVAFSGAPEAFTSFIPAAASAAGAAGAFFQTDLEVNNRGDEAAEVVFRWLARGLNNAEPLESAPVALPPGRSLRFDNVLDALFGLAPDAVGALAMVADRPDVLAMSRTYNLPAGKAAGTFGQGLPAIPEAEMLTGTGRWRLIFLSEDADARANVGCVNGAAERTVVTLEIFDAAGTLLQTRTLSLPPYSNNQINRVLGAWQPVDGYVDVAADRDDARYYCYGSMLDNLTSDPTTILPQSPSDPLTFVPAAALAAGLEGAFFQTDLDLNNAGASPLSYELRWLPRGADSSDAVRGGPFSLAPGAGVRYANVLAEVFGLAPDQVGGLAIEASGPELLAMSRTYNVPPAKAAGTFGQELAGVPADRLLATGERRRILFMNENDDVRSNVGCQNGGLAAATVKLELYSSEGVRLGVRTMDLPPRSNSQITRIFRSYAPITAGYVDLWTDTPGAAVYCYGSVLDNLTSDPTTVLPQ